jgi:hypothetical protein
MRLALGVTVLLLASSPAANDDAIKLRDTFVGDSYVSVSFAIDALPLFTR